MLTVACCLLLQGIVLWGIGHWVWRAMRPTHDQPLEAILLLGMGATGLLAHTLCVFFPIGWALQVFVCLIGTAAWFDRTFYAGLRTYRMRLNQLSAAERTLFVLLAITAITLAAGPLIRDDSESYHLQNILWIREYGTVPGLANLHSRFGFNSSWFAAGALLVPTGQHNFYTTLNTCLSLVMASMLLTPLSHRRPDPTPYRMAKVAALFTLFACWYYWRGNIQSTNYDYYFTTVVVLFFLLYHDELLDRSAGCTWALLLPPLLCTIRPLYAPTLLFTLYALYQKRSEKKYGFLFLYLLAVCVLLGLFLYRNFILSGHPLYPSQILSFTNPRWQVPPEQLDQLQAYIRGFVWPTDTDLWSGLKGWIKNLYDYDRIFLGLGLLGGVIAGIRILKNNRSFPVLVAVVLFLQFIVWFGVSPEPRFIAGVFIVGQLLLYKNLLLQIPKRILPAKTLQAGLIGSFILLNAMLLTQKWTQESSSYGNWFWPSKLPKPESHIFTREGIRFQIPEKWNGNWNARCYLTPLPCVYDTLPGVRLMGNKIEDGFYVEQYRKRDIP